MRNVPHQTQPRSRFHRLCDFISDVIISISYYIQRSSSIFISSLVHSCDWNRSLNTLSYFRTVKRIVVSRNIVDLTFWNEKRTKLVLVRESEVLMKHVSFSRLFTTRFFSLATIRHSLFSVNTLARPEINIYLIARRREGKNCTLQASKMFWLRHRVQTTHAQIQISVDRQLVCPHTFCSIKFVKTFPHRYFAKFFNNRQSLIHDFQLRCSVLFRFLQKNPNF